MNSVIRCCGNLTARACEQVKFATRVQIERTLQGQISTVDRVGYVVLSLLAARVAAQNLFPPTTPLKMLGGFLVVPALVTGTFCYFFDLHTRRYRDHRDNNDGRLVYQDDVHLILTGCYDGNGALALGPAAFWSKAANDSALTQVYRDVATIKDIEDAVSDVKHRMNRIRLLWIDAHGSPSSMILSKETSYPDIGVVNAWDARAQRDLRRICKRLDPDGVIVLNSCFTGRSGKDIVASVAQLFAQCAPGRKVYAPTETVNYHSAKYSLDADGRPEVRFAAPFRIDSNNTVCRIVNFTLATVHALSGGIIGRDATACYRTG